MVENDTYNELFRPIVEELKLLEDGIKMEIDGKVETIYETLTALVADYLASHQVGGLKQGFTKGFRKCRTCLGVDEDIQNLFCDSDFIHRTKEEHIEYCEALKAEGLFSHFSKLYGVMSNSVFNELKYFHIIGGLVPDIMHDLLEGTVPKITSLFIHYCLGKKYFNLEELNGIIANFKYGSAEIKDKPSPITVTHL